MSSVITVGVVTYDPKVVTIWEGIKGYFTENSIATDFVLFSNYDAQVDALLNGWIDIAWNTNLAYVKSYRRTAGKCGVLAMRLTRDCCIRELAFCILDAMKNEMLEFALSLAQAAESQIMPMFRACTVNWKSDGSEVTEADRRAEGVMREIIGKRLPGHAILGEEYGGSQAPTTEPLWVLDPIDGTASFAVGLPIFGTLIGYVENGEPQLGVIHFPAMEKPSMRQGVRDVGQNFEIALQRRCGFRESPL